jgi:hypothetical protein
MTKIATVKFAGVLRVLALVIGLAISLGLADQASAGLPTGTWTINANGYEGQLIISSVGPNGQLSGSIFGNLMQGFWNDVSKTITFMRISDPINQSTIQIYRVTCSRTQESQPQASTRNYSPLCGVVTRV